MHASIKLIMCTLKKPMKVMYIHSSYVLMCNIKALLNSVAKYRRITSIVCIFSLLL